MNEQVLVTDLDTIKLTPQFVAEAREKWPGSELVPDIRINDDGEEEVFDHEVENWVDPVIEAVGSKRFRVLTSLADLGL